MANREVLEADMAYVENKTSTASLALKKFDSNAERIQKIKDKMAELIRELKALHEELKVLEVDQGTIQANLLVLNAKLAKIPLNHEESIYR